MSDDKVFSALIDFQRTWELPEELFAALGDQSKVLIIATSGYKKILCFPTNSRGVYRIKVLLDEKGLSPDFFTSLRDKTKSFNLQPVYNTGICTKETQCYWEGFFWSQADDIDHEALKGELQTVVNVTDVEMEHMAIGNK